MLCRFAKSDPEIRGHSQTTLTKFCTLLTTYLLLYTYKGIPLFIVDISITTYLIPCHVNVVKEGPLKGVKEGLASAVSLIRPFF